MGHIGGQGTCFKSDCFDEIQAYVFTLKVMDLSLNEKRPGTTGASFLFND